MATLPTKSVAITHRQYITEFQYSCILKNWPKIGPKFADQLPAVDGLDSLENSYFFKFFKIILHSIHKDFNGFLLYYSNNFQTKTDLACLNRIFL